MKLLVFDNLLKLSAFIWISIKIYKPWIHHCLITCFQPNLLIKLLYFLKIMHIKFMLIWQVFYSLLVFKVTFNYLVFFIVTLSINNISNFTVMIYLVGYVLLSYGIIVLYSAYYFHITPWWCQYFVYFCCCTSFFIHFYI